MFNIFFSEIGAFCEIVWKNVVKRVKPQMTIWRMRIACWIPKVTDTQYSLFFHYNNGLANIPQC